MLSNLFAAFMFFKLFLMLTSVTPEFCLSNSADRSTGCFVTSVPPSKAAGELDVEALVLAIFSFTAGVSVATSSAWTPMAPRTPVGVDENGVVRADEAVGGALEWPDTSEELIDGALKWPDTPDELGDGVARDVEELESAEGEVRGAGVLDGADVPLLPVFWGACAALVAPVGDLGLGDVEVEPSRSSNSAKKLLETNELSVACRGMGLAAFRLSTRWKPSSTMKHALSAPPSLPSSMALRPPAAPALRSGHCAELCPFLLHCQHSRWLFSTSGLVQRPSCSWLQLGQRRFRPGAWRGAGGPVRPPP